MGIEAEIPRVRDQPVQHHLRCTRGWPKDLDATLQKLVGRKAKGVLKKMQKACLPGTLNIVRTFKVVI